MKNVFKYSLHTQGIQSFVFGVGSELLSVQRQGLSPVLYVAVNTETSEHTSFDIAAVLTGERIPDYFTQYLGTLVFANGSFVVHYFAALPTEGPVGQEGRVGAPL